MNSVYDPFAATASLGKALLQNLTSLVIGVDVDGTVRYWNCPCEDTFGRSAKEVLGERLIEAIAAVGDSRFREEIEKAVTDGGVRRFDDIAFTSPDGRHGLLGLTLYPVFEGGSRNGAVILGRDITRFKQMEQRLFDAQKMESMWQLGSGMAHEINSPIQFITNNLEFVAESFEELKPIFDAVSGTADDVKRAAAEVDLGYLLNEIPLALEQTRIGVKKVADIVAAMLDFSQTTVEAVSAFDLADCVDNVVTITEGRWKPLCVIEKDFGRGPFEIKGWRAELNQALLEVVLNAIASIEEKAQGKKGFEGHLHFELEKQQQRVVLKIADNGVGVPESIKSRIFDPFFTTREVGQGRGQGLTTAWRTIVERHSGSIDALDSDKGGATFVIALPLAP